MLCEKCRIYNITASSIYSLYNKYEPLHFNYISAEYYTQVMDKVNTVFNLQNQPMYTVYT